MREYIRKIVQCTATILLCIAMVSGIIFGYISEGQKPLNPMNENSLTASGDYDLDYSDNPDNNNADKNNSNNINNSEKNTDSDENNNDLNENNNESQTDNNGKSDTSNQSDGNGSSGSNEAHNLSQKNSSGKNSDGKGKTKTAKEVYFTTSIVDGETVSTYEYSFTITHLVEELTVEDVSVWTNNIKEVNFSGKVLLKENANKIKIAVTYRSKDGKEIIAQKTYTVNVNTNGLFISTDLKNKTVENPFLDFTASAGIGQVKADLTVNLNGTEVTGEENKYSVTLVSGKNIIELKAKYDKYSLVRTYEIIFKAKEQYRIYTTLESKTVNEDRIDFKALIINGTQKAKLTVIANGKIVPGKNNSYSVPLNTGKNTIRLKATDTNSETINEKYIIEYIPVATEETEPKLTYINVSDNMEISGKKFTLNIAAKDYLGNKIYYDGIRVKLNGKKLQYRWSAKYISYLLELTRGLNTLEIRLTDGEGRYKDFSYRLNCTFVEDGTPIGYVKVGMDAKVIGIGTLMKQKTVELNYGDNCADIVEKAFKNSGYTYTYGGTYKEGFYLESVARPGMLRGWKIDDKLRDEIIEDGLQFNIVPETGQYVYDMDSLSQLDFCQGSGWTYSVNGDFKEYGMSDYEPKDGDDIQLRYTLAYGKDIGAYNSSGGMYGIKDHYENTY